MIKIFVYLIFSVCQAQITSNFNCRPNGCCDQHEWCGFWSSIGECDSNHNWMSNNCKIACRVCSSEDQPTVQPTSSVTVLSASNQALRCSEIQTSQPNSTAKLMKMEGLVSDHEDVSFKKTFSVSDIFSSNKNNGCAPQQEPLQQDCTKNACYNAMYRTMDGSCNNLKNPLQGAAATPFMRLKNPAYDDGQSAPIGSQKNNRPSAREASRFMLSSSQLVTNKQWNMLLMQFGQFIVHDIAKTSLLPNDACSGCSEQPSEKCFPIKVTAADQRFGRCAKPPCCLTFTRAAPVCNSNPRQQLNEQTAFLDGSQIYGFSMSDGNRLRDTAMLKSTAFNSKVYLPFNQQQCSGPTSCQANFDAGDNRITIFVGLVAFHTLFLREHNRIAQKLMQINPRWGKDRIFQVNPTYFRVISKNIKAQETRKIIGAQLQAVVFKEWLPKIMGKQVSTLIGEYRAYNPAANPSIAEHFVYGAMRFGHGMIQEAYSRLDANNQNIPEGGLKFDEGILKPSKLLFEGGMDPVLRGLMNMAVKKPQRLTTSLTESMFGSTDLAAMNIQRGRDTGLPSYNEWREFCGLRKASNFDEFSAEIIDPTVRNNLQQGFGNPDNVDLYIGAIVEDPLVNGLVGPTVACLLGEQFKRIRDGDRFWYQNPSVFTPEQLIELEKATLSRIICENGDDFRSLPRDAFDLVNSTNLLPCGSIPSIDLEKWRD